MLIPRSVARRLITRIFSPEFRKYDNSPNVEEKSYRESRLCRLLGNPLAFRVVELLAESGELSVGEMARTLGRSVELVSTVLGTLRVAEVVRYNTDGRRNRYRLKQP